MYLVKLHVEIKFRCRGITLGTSNADFDLPWKIPAVPGLQPGQFIIYDKQGVKAVALLVPTAVVETSFTPAP